jgi:hypothetical protein
VAGKKCADSLDAHESLHGKSPIAARFALRAVEINRGRNLLKKIRTSLSKKESERAKRRKSPTNKSKSMAGYSRLYCIGGEGGFRGADGINPILFQILVGDADRQWLEVHYFTNNIKPLSGITRIIPSGPNDEHALLDACIIFYPEYFSTCPTMDLVRQQLRPADLLDFHLETHRVPRDWQKLREEARVPFAKLHIWEAMLRQLQ